MTPIPPIPTTALGHSTVAISTLGLGCMGMSDFYGTPNDDESIATIHRALDIGITFFDTADVYAIGDNERLLARALKGHRHRAVIATKFGLVRGADGSWNGVDGSPAAARARCEDSLARLGVDEIDLYYLHRVDPVVPIEETVGAMGQLVREGKARAIGLSEAAAETIRRAHRTHPISAVQSEFSLWTRDLELAVIPACAELGITFVPYAPLGRGMLTGVVTDPEALPVSDYRRRTPRFQGENFIRNRQIAERVRTLAEAKGCTPAQLALAWSIAHGNAVYDAHRRARHSAASTGAAGPGTGVVPIPGTKRRAYLDQNALALAVALTDDELAAIEREFPLESAAAGTRYPEFRMGELNR